MLGPTKTKWHWARGLRLVAVGLLQSAGQQVAIGELGGVKGHFSYREIAWEMKRKMEQAEPELGRLMEATPPWVEDPVRR
jgi:hypothetical protein